MQLILHDVVYIVVVVYPCSDVVVVVVVAVAVGRLAVVDGVGDDDAK
jgi:hypothetical protein